MFSASRVLAVIPARGGSKGIPRKNLARVGGRTLIEHAARTVRALNWVDRTVLSTDDDEIAEEGRRCGLDVLPRPDSLATDDALGSAVWRHAWLEVEAASDFRYDIGVLLQPTSPLRTSRDVSACVELLVDENRDVVITVSPMPAHFAPEKAMVIDSEGALAPYLQEGFKSLRQGVPSYFFLNGYCYAARRERVVEEARIHGPNVGAVVVDRPVVNVDEPFDLEIAEWLSGRSAARPTSTGDSIEPPEARQEVGE